MFQHLVEVANSGQQEPVVDGRCAICPLAHLGRRLLPGHVQGAASGMCCHLEGQRGLAYAGLTGEDDYNAPNAIEYSDDGGETWTEQHAVRSYRIVDVAEGSYTFVDHENRTFFRTTFEEMMAGLENMAEGALEDAPPVDDEEPADQDEPASDVALHQPAAERDEHGHLRIAEVVELDMQLEGGKVALYRAKVKVSFKYEGGA